MGRGFLIETGCGEFHVESIDLLQSIHGRTVHEVCKEDKDLEEVEQYLRHGLIGFEKTVGQRLVVPEVFRKYVPLYDRCDTTWFFYVPLKIEVDITKQCNLRCKHCSRDASVTTSTGKLSLQDYVDIFQQAGSAGVQELSFMGGEPTCNPSFVELATVARMFGIKTLFTSTNGWLVTEKLAEKMAVLFDSVQVSIHGPDAATHDAIVGRPGSFSRACEAVRLLKKHRVASLNISCTVMNENSGHLNAMVALARSLGAPSIRFLSLFSKGRGRQLDQLGSQDKEGISEQIRAFRSEKCGSMKIEAGGVPNYSSVRTDAAIYGCPAGRSLMYINADGDVGACGNLAPVVGSIRDTRLMDLWHSPSMVQLRKKPSCGCSYTGICAGGCLGNEYWRNMFDVATTPIG